MARNVQQNALNLMSTPGITITNAVDVTSRTRNRDTLALYKLARIGGISHNRAMMLMHSPELKRNVQNIHTTLSRQRMSISNQMRRIGLYINLRNQGHNHEISKLAVVR